MCHLELQTTVLNSRNAGGGGLHLRTWGDVAEPVNMVEDEAKAFFKSKKLIPFVKANHRPQHQKTPQCSYHFTVPLHSILEGVWRPKGPSAVQQHSGLTSKARSPSLRITSN